MSVDSISTSVPQSAAPISEDLENEKVTNTAAEQNLQVSETTTAENEPQIGVGAGETLPVLDDPEAGKTIEQLLLLLTALNIETNSEQMVSTKEGIEIDRAAMESRHNDRMAQIEKSIEALEKADKTGLFGKIAGWLGTAAMIIAGAALIASGAGAVAGGLMLAGAAVMITSQVSGETGDWMNEGLADMFEAMGVPEDQTALAASLLITGVVIALSVGSGVAGAMAPATSTALTAVRVGQAANLAGSTASVGEGAAGVATAEYSRQAAFAQADAAEQRAFIQELMLFLQGKNDQLSDLLNEYQQAVGVATDTLESTHATKTQVANNIGA